jgi:hypothetical protein
MRNEIPREKAGIRPFVIHTDGQNRKKNNRTGKLSAIG